MNFQIFGLLCMLFIQSINTQSNFTKSRTTTKPRPRSRFTISAVEPEINLCFGTFSFEDTPTWTIQVNFSATKNDLNNYKDPILIDINRDHSSHFELCKISVGDGSKGRCPPPKIPWDGELACYCSSSKNGQYSLKITRIAFVWESEALLWIKSPFEEYERKLPVVIQAQTCFSFDEWQHRVNKTSTINASQIWDAQGYLNVANEHKSSYLSEVKVKIDSLLFCTINLTDCFHWEWEPRPTGDIICRCESVDNTADYDEYSLNITATAQGSQSQAKLSVELSSTSGGEGVTEIIGTLPTIIGPSTIKSQVTTLPTTTEENTTEENSSILKFILLVVVTIAVSFICVAVLWYFIKYINKKRNVSKTAPKKTESKKTESKKTESKKTASKRKQSTYVTDQSEDDIEEMIQKSVVNRPSFWSSTAQSDQQSKQSKSSDDSNTHKDHISYIEGSMERFEPPEGSSVNWY